MCSEIEILEALDSLAEALSDNDRKQIRGGMGNCAELLPHPCSEEELAALAVLSRETQRGNLLTDIGHLQAAAKDYHLRLRWDVVLASLAEREYIAVLDGSGNEGPSDVHTLAALRGSEKRQLRIALRLQDPDFDPALEQMGYASNKSYLQDCFSYLDLLLENRDLQKGGRSRKKLGASTEKTDEGNTAESKYAYLRRKGSLTDPLPPLEALAQELNLDRSDWTMLLLVLRGELEGDLPEVHDLIEIAGSGDLFDRYTYRGYFEGDGTLIANGIIELDGVGPLMRQDVVIDESLSSWLVNGGDSPRNFRHSEAEPAESAFENNEAFLSAWCDVAKFLMNDEENSHLPPQFRRRRRRPRKGEAAEKLPEVQSLLRRIGESGTVYPFEQIARDMELDVNERIILGLALYAGLKGGGVGIQNATEALGGTDYFKGFRCQRYFRDGSPLRKHGLIDVEEGFMGSSDYTIPDSILQRILEENSLESKEAADFDGSQLFERRQPGHNLDSAVLPVELRKSLDVAMGSVHGEQLERLRAWGIEHVTATRPSGSVLLLFHGPPGTGKTYTAEAFAASLGRDLLITDATKILSKWYGGSESQLQRMFSSYARLMRVSEKPPVLLLNECDQLMGRRESSGGGGRSTDQTEHRLQNILLEQLERFPGILIATTNLMESLDDAFSRRFDYKISFAAPDMAARVALWKGHIPVSVPRTPEVDFERLSERFTFTGGQIAIAAANALRTAASRGDKLTMEDLVGACEQESQGAFEKTGGLFGFRG
ncbi:MAG: AAA family ATPase [Bacteroidota bacterium]